MKLSLAFLMVVFVGLVTIACSGAPGTQTETGSDIEGNSAVSQVVLEVSTITCTGCWPRVEASAKSVPGVKDVQFDIDNIQKMIVTYDPTLTTPDAIIEAIEERGDMVTKVTDL